MTGRKNKRHPGSKPIGQPTLMTEALQLKILQHVSAGGTVASYCRKHKYPHPDTVFNFMATSNGEKFSDDMIRARERGTHAIAEQCLDIIDDKKEDTMRARNRVDTRLRLAAAWNRKAYGPKQDVDVTNRLTIGELVEASMREAAARKMLDITPAAPAQLAAPSMVIDPPTDQSPGLSALSGFAHAVMAEPVAAPARKPRRAASA